jgi:hypothetical protein
MNYVLVFRPEVRDELDEAYNWYESQTRLLKALAFSLIKALQNIIRILAATN